jgi:hypothetical protein
LKKYKQKSEKNGERNRRMIYELWTENNFMEDKKEEKKNISKREV